MLKCDSTCSEDEQIWMSKRIGLRIEQLQYAIYPGNYCRGILYDVWCVVWDVGVGSWDMNVRVTHERT